MELLSEGVIIEEVLHIDEVLLIVAEIRELDHGLAECRMEGLLILSILLHNGLQVSVSREVAREHQA